MREISFRAWDKKYKEMIPDIAIFPEYGWLVQSDNDALAERERPARGQIILMQYTGLKDKNGKEIYEGDVLSFRNSMISSEDPMPDIRIIKWDDEYAGFCHAYIDGNCRVSGYSWCKSNAEKMFEIIGNIYENPELLEQK